MLHLTHHCLPTTVLGHIEDYQRRALLSYWDYHFYNCHMRNKMDHRLEDVLQWGSSTYTADVAAVFHFSFSGYVRVYACGHISV